MPSVLERAYWSNYCLVDLYKKDILPFLSLKENVSILETHNIRMRTTHILQDIIKLVPPTLNHRKIRNQNKEEWQDVLTMKVQQ